MKQISKNKRFLLIFSLLLVLGFLSASTAWGLEVNWPTAPGGKNLTDDSTLVDFVEYLYRWGILLGGLAAFFALIMAGFRYLTSVGDPMKMKDARDRIIAAILGLVLLLSTYLILNTLNPELTTLRAPTTTVPGLGGGIWTPPDWDEPCEFVTLYKSRNYQNEHLTIVDDGTWPDFNDCVRNGDEGLFGWGSWSTDINSVRVKGACQLNMYEHADCSGNFSAVAKSTPNLDWIVLDNVYSFKAVDIAPPRPPSCNYIGAPVYRGNYTVPNPDPPPVNLDKRRYVFEAIVDDIGGNDIAYGFFEYGENEQYLNYRVPLNPNNDVEVFVDTGPGNYYASTVAPMEPLRALDPATTYYWRCGVRTDAGYQSFGTTSSFTTRP